jgi:hypothetical protein
VRLLWGVARLFIGLALVAAGCDKVFLGPPFCPEGQLFCANFDTRDRGEQQFESHYQTSGTTTFEAGPAVSPPNSFNAVADPDTTEDYTILQHALEGSRFHGLIDFWIASPNAAVECRPYAVYLRLDNDPPDAMPYQIQFRLGINGVTTYVQSPPSPTSPTGIVSLITAVANPKIFHHVAIDVDVPNQSVTVSVDDETPRPVPDVDLSGALNALPEIQIGIDIPGSRLLPCSVLIDDLIIYER